MLLLYEYQICRENCCLFRDGLLLFLTMILTYGPYLVFDIYRLTGILSGNHLNSGSIVVAGTMRATALTVARRWPEFFIPKESEKIRT